MRLSLFVLLVLVLVVFVDCGVLFDRTEVPKGWVKQSRAPSSSSVSFIIGLYQQNLDVAENKLYEISDPEHESYQQFMTINEINDLVAAKKEDQLLVTEWLMNGGVKEEQMKNFYDSIEVVTTVAIAESLFSTQLFDYKHMDGSNAIRSFGPHSVPNEIHQVISVVTGISTFPMPHFTALKHKKEEAAKRHLLQATTTGTIAQTVSLMYNLPAQRLSSSLLTSQGVIEFQGQNYNTSDIAYYGGQIGIPLESVKPQHIVGSNDPTNPQTEATLDIEMVASVNIEADNWFWLEDGNNWLYEFGVHFFQTKSVPLVNSISYGWWEGDQCSIDAQECQTLGTDSTGYVRAVNAQFLKIGLRGISLIASSGDSGANGRTDDACTIPQLRPAFPSSSPFVTSVGATQLNNPQFNLPGANNIPICTQNGYQCASGGQEVAVSYAVAGFASGGGFSNISTVPPYQAAAVAAYFRSGVTMPPASYFNKGGRGSPDVAALGNNGLIEQGGQFSAVGGTSMSSPIVAAVFSLLNQVAIRTTGKPLGFLNPFIYKAFAANPRNFNDITIGDNICTENGCTSTCTGYVTAPGWDPVTGVGSPNYLNLAKYLQSTVEARAVKFGPKVATE